MTEVINKDLEVLEDNDGFENFAAVVFAAALDHDGAYGRSGEELKSFIAAKELERIAGTTTPAPVKKVPELILGESKFFERRAAAKAAAAKAEAAAAGVTTPDFVSPYKGKASLDMINQFWGKSASDPIKEAPKLNLKGSKLFKRRAEAEAAKAAKAVAADAPSS